MMRNRNYLLNTITAGDTQEWLQRMREKYDDVSKRWYATIAPMNLMAGIYMMDAIDMIEEKGLNRQNIKRLTARAENGLSAFQVALRIVLRSKNNDGLETNRYNLVQNVANQLYARTRNDLLYLRIAIKSRMDKSGEPDSEFKSYVILANTLLDFSLRLFDDFFKGYKEQTKTDFSRNFSRGRLTGVASTFYELTSILCRTRTEINYNEDRQCHIAFEAFSHRIADHDMLNEAGIEAMRFDEVYSKMIDD